MTTAVLGFKIDSSQATGAAADLDRLSVSAGKADVATAKAGESASRASRNFGDLGPALQKIVSGIDRLNQTSSAIETRLEALGKSAASAARNTKGVGDAATASSADLDKLRAQVTSLTTALEALRAKADKPIPPKMFNDQDEHVRAFRMEVERLTAKYQPLTQATRNYENTIREVQTAHKMGLISADQMTQRLEAERQAFDRLKNSATTAGAAVTAANGNRPAAGGSFQTANIAAQFQDIGVTAAMGMSPMMIALQQGTQLSAALGPMGAAGAVKSLGAAFASVISPVSLVTIGLVAGTAALIQYFMAAEDGTDKTSKLFEEQNDTIRRAAELWGDATPALKAYVDELDRADKITQGKEAGAILAGRELDGLSENLDGLKRQGIEAFRALQGDANNAVVVRDLRDAWGDLRERLDNGTASMADLNRVQRELSSAVSQYGVPEVLAFRDAFDDVTAAIYRGVEAAQEARTAWIAALAGGTNVQDILSGSTFTEGGKTYSPNSFVPLNAPRPTGRPLDLAGDPDPTNIMNSDGRLVGVPIPGQKPNQFELEKEAEAVDDVTKAYRRAQEAQADFWLDLSFQERQATRSSTDQKIATTLTRYGFSENLQSPEANALRQQMRGEEAKGLFKDFFSGAYSEAWSNGGKIGDALGKSALNAAQKATEKAWDAVFDKLATGLSNWLTGSGKTGNTSGVSSVLGATTTLGDLVGANDNKSFSAPVGAVARAALPPTTEIGSYIAKAAAARGIDPDIALRVAKSEGGLDSWNLQSNYVKNGVREPSFGPFQLYKGGGLGNKFMDKTGLDPANAAAGPAGVDFALDEAKKSGWGAWYGAGKAGIGDWEGIDKSAKAISDLGAAATDTAQMTSGLGQTLASIPQALMGNGGGSGILSSLTKYGMGLFSGSAQFASAWSSGGIGLYANGTDSAPGGLSMVGERGPELVNLPQGSGVISNHKLMAALSNDNGPRRDAGPRQLNVNVLGANGDAHVMSLVQQGVGEALAQDREADRRGGWGEKNRRFGNQKA
jgi:prefoldin subunit 5